MRLKFDRLVDDHTEDSGAAHILEFDCGIEADEGLFVRVLSWCPRARHEELDPILSAIERGDRVVVTLTIEQEQGEEQ